MTSATYFELIDLKMLKVRVSVQTCGNLEPDLVILKRELGLRSLMKFEDASLRVNEFRLERPFVNVAMLTRLIVAHYRHEVLRQAYKIVGSIDLLGNPIGIVQVCLESSSDASMLEVLTPNLATCGITGSEFWG